MDNTVNPVSTIPQSLSNDNLFKYKFDFDDFDGETGIESEENEENVESVGVQYESENQPGIRWDPLGADNNTCDIKENEIMFDKTDDSYIDLNRIQSLEEEQEILTSSLLALTSHFAQVQLRLRQIVQSPVNERDQLLKNLEEFAFRGIPEINKGDSIKIQSPNTVDSETSELKTNESAKTESGNTDPIYHTKNLINSMENQKTRQSELIEQLKSQLEDLEKYAYETGEPVLPQSILVEKQKIIIDELKNKINLNLNEYELPQLTSDDLRQHVDTALGQFVSPLKMKEQLVNQLKTQIIDLERFIKFLQGETYGKKLREKKLNKNNCNCPCSSDNINMDMLNKKFHNDNSSAITASGSSSTSSFSTATSGTIGAHSSNFQRSSFTPNSNQSIPLQDSTLSFITKTVTLLQMFAISQFGCGASSVRNNNGERKFQKNILKHKSKFNHWGDIRAKLEVDVQEVLLFVKNNNEENFSSDMSNSVVVQEPTPKKTSSSIPNHNMELTLVVRKNLTTTIRRLMQHGLRSANETTSLVPFIGCFNVTPLNSAGGSTATDYYDDGDCDYEDNQYYYSNNHSNCNMHAWQLILEYYNLKNGDKYNSTTVRKLSQSFNLNIIDENAITNKQSLLSAIGTIIAIHSPYKRSYNAHFKAFICSGLNNHKLVQWLNLIFQCKELINMYYDENSYVICTGFHDALGSLDRLTKYDFDLPIDLAVKQFQNIKDIF